VTTDSRQTKTDPSSHQRGHPLMTGAIMVWQCIKKLVTNHKRGSMSWQKDWLSVIK